MKKFRLKLTYILILMIGLSVLLSGFFLVQILEKSHIPTIQEHRLREIRTILANIEWKHDGDMTSDCPLFSRRRSGCQNQKA